MAWGRQQTQSVRKRARAAQAAATMIAQAAKLLGLAALGPGYQVPSKPESTMYLEADLNWGASRSPVIDLQPRSKGAFGAILEGLDAREKRYVILRSCGDQEASARVCVRPRVHDQVPHLSFIVLLLDGTR
ncbi:hypothetical protein BDZ91DRAFT_760018 [Kalaharituber pfeilii]|nr:hypothetical protein BDZ91DRAFT_760018 [Kalaharituber pfeilii]